MIRATFLIVAFAVVGFFCQPTRACGPNHSHGYTCPSRSISLRPVCIPTYFVLETPRFKVVAVKPCPSLCREKPTFQVRWQNVARKWSKGPRATCGPRHQQRRDHDDRHSRRDHRRIGYGRRR